MLGQKPSKELATIAEGFIFFLAAVGGGRSHCIAVERVRGFSVILAFALQGLARFVCIENHCDRPADTTANKNKYE